MKMIAVDESCVAAVAAAAPVENSTKTNTNAHTIIGRYFFMGTSSSIGVTEVQITSFSLSEYHLKENKRALSVKVFFFLIISEELADILIKVMIDRILYSVQRRLSYPLSMSSRISMSRSGFTLIELIAVLAIIGVLASLSIPRFIEVESSASRQALVSRLSELNSRESLTWSQVKLSTTGWVDDAGVFSEVNTDMGPDFQWAPPAALDGGNLHFKDQLLKLEREPSQPTRAGRWAEKN